MVASVAGTGCQRGLGRGRQTTLASPAGPPPTPPPTGHYRVAARHQIDRILLVPIRKVVEVVAAAHKVAWGQAGKSARVGEWRVQRDRARSVWAASRCTSLAPALATHRVSDFAPSSSRPQMSRLPVRVKALFMAPAGRGWGRGRRARHGQGRERLGAWSWCQRRSWRDASHIQRRATTASNMHHGKATAPVPAYCMDTSSPWSAHITRKATSICIALHAKGRVDEVASALPVRHGSRVARLLLHARTAVVWYGAQHTPCEPAPRRGAHQLGRCSTLACWHQWG